MPRLAPMLMCAAWCSAAARICVGVCSGPAAIGLARSVGVAEAVDVLTFRSTPVDGVRVDSVAIEGPSPAIGTLLAVPLRVPTNVGADGVWRSLALP